MPLSNFSFTMLVIAVILAAAGAPLLPVYVCCGIGAIWQLLVTFAQPGAVPPDDDEPRDA